MKRINFGRGALTCALVCTIALCLTGCTGMITRALVPDVKLHLNDKELEHLKLISTDYNDTLLELGGLEDKKKALALAAYVYKGNKRTTDIKPGAAETAIQQYMRMTGREGLEEQIKMGFEWTTRTVLQAAGGATGGGGLIAAIIALARRNKRTTKKLNIHKEAIAESTDLNLANAIKEKAKHTEVENEV